MRYGNGKNIPNVEIILRRQLVGAVAGRSYDISVTGYYDKRQVLNVEIHWPKDIDERDDPGLERWQTQYVATLGRRVP